MRFACARQSARAASAMRCASLRARRCAPPLESGDGLEDGRRFRRQAAESKTTRLPASRAQRALPSHMRGAGRERRPRAMPRESARGPQKAARSSRAFRGRPRSRRRRAPSHAPSRVPGLGRRAKADHGPAGDQRRPVGRLRRSIARGDRLGIMTVDTASRPSRPLRSARSDRRNRESDAGRRSDIRLSS